MFESGFQVVPAALEELPAGAVLAGVLEGLDPARASPCDMVRLVAVQRRQPAHQQACSHACAARVAILVRWTVALSGEHAAAVIDRLVDEAAGRTPASDQ